MDIIFARIRKNCEIFSCSTSESALLLGALSRHGRRETSGVFREVCFGAETLCACCSRHSVNLIDGRTEHVGGLVLRRSSRWKLTGNIVDTDMPITHTTLAIGCLLHEHVFQQGHCHQISDLAQEDEEEFRSLPHHDLFVRRATYSGTDLLITKNNQPIQDLIQSEKTQKKRASKLDHD